MIGKIFIHLVLIINFVMTLDDDLQIKINELEKQKSDLYEQIQTAIDESVKSLVNANDSESILGLKYMRDLKNHLKELNRTSNESQELKVIDVDSKSDLENRRRFKGIKYFNDIKKHKSDLFDFETILKPKKMSEKDWKEMIGNRFKLQQKLNMWITERQKEKDRLKQLKMEKRQLEMSGKYERCPRFGYYGKKKGTDKRRMRSRQCVIEVNTTTGQRYEKCYVPQEMIEERRKRRKTKLTEKYKYPCCRKCCKKSYMGCL